MEITELAGLVGAVVFATSHMPMLRKAIRTKDVRSYSLGNLVLVNTGNLVYTAYVVTLPIGPVWALHSFYVIAAAIMLVLYVRQQRRDRRPSTADRGAGRSAVPFIAEEMVTTEEESRQVAPQE